MTLITYLSRVHLADGVLEVALSSELELNKLSRPLLVFEQAAIKGEFTERVIAGLHHRCNPDFHEIPANQSLNSAGVSLLKRLRGIQPDVVVAFGSSLALSAADVSCGQFNITSRKAAGSAPAQTQLIVIPGVDGVPAISARCNAQSHSGGSAANSQPIAIIIDPTLIMGESIERTSCAIADTLARCLSVHFSDSYNPPAGGIALDGVRRIVRNLTSLLEEDSLDMRRELMAAGLNATLAMQGQGGIAHALGDILLRKSAGQVNKGALMRLLILVEAQLLEQYWSEKRCTEVRAALDVPAGKTIRDWLCTIMETLPLPDSLYQLGFSHRDISKATQEFSANMTTGHSAQYLERLLIDFDLHDRSLHSVN